MENFEFGSSQHLDSLFLSLLSFSLPLSSLCVDAAHAGCSRALARAAAPLWRARCACCCALPPGLAADPCPTRVRTLPDAARCRALPVDARAAPSARRRAAIVAVAPKPASPLPAPPAAPHCRCRAADRGRPSMPRAVGPQTSSLSSLGRFKRPEHPPRARRARARPFAPPPHSRLHRAPNHHHTALLEPRGPASSLLHRRGAAAAAPSCHRPPAPVELRLRPSSTQFEPTAPFLNSHRSPQARTPHPCAAGEPPPRHRPTAAAPFRGAAATGHPGPTRDRH